MFACASKQPRASVRISSTDLPHGTSKHDSGASPDPEPELPDRQNWITSAHKEFGMAVKTTPLPVLSHSSTPTAAALKM
jgi:hypothetical protein